VLLLVGPGGARVVEAAADPLAQGTTPKISLAGFTVFGRPLEQTQPMPSVTCIELDSTQHTFTFELTDGSGGELLEEAFSYILVGLDPSWSHPTRQRYIRYTNVAPGSYTFRFRPTDGLDATGALEQAVTVVVAPHLWQTWWFRSGVLLLLAGVVWTLHRARLHSIRDQKRQLEHLVRQRTEELEGQHRQVQRQEEHLHLINGIVKSINAQIEFEDMLQEILEGVGFVQGAELAFALVRRSTTGLFDAKASVGWEIDDPGLSSLSETDIEQRYLADTEQVTEGVFRGPVDTDSGVFETGLQGRVTRAILVMRIDDGQGVAGYLVFSNTQDDQAFAALDPVSISDLREHVTFAFLKVNMLQELKLLNEKKDEFLGIAAHDLRSPLAGVLTYVDLLIRFLDDPDRNRRPFRKFLGNVKVMTEQMRAMVEDLLDVAAIETGRLELHLEQAKMHELVAECCRVNQEKAAAKQIELTVEQGIDEVEVCVDPARIAEVFDNLVSNAIKFTQVGGSVRIKCVTSDDEVSTNIIDNGQGLATTEIEQVFSGKRLSARPTAGETSTGLGLVIVKKIVELHQGKVWAQSRKGEGSTFSFSLPLQAKPQHPQLGRHAGTGGQGRAPTPG